MIEGFIRAFAPRLQSIYELMPPPVQNAIVTGRGWFLTRYRYHPRTYALLRELQLHERWDSEQIAAYQLRALQRTVSHALQTVPYYATYPRTELTKLEDLTNFPVLPRETVRQNSDRLVSNAVPKCERIRVGTTGTTGANLKVTSSTNVAQKNWAFWVRQWLWAGVEARQPRITLYGSRIVPPARTSPPYWAYNLYERQILMSIFNLSTATARDYVSFLKRHSGSILEGFPTVLGIIADFVLQMGQPIPMRAVLSSGEPLYPFVRKRIEQAFETRAWDSYLMTEMCGLIQECEHRQMHLIPEYGYLEILDEENRPVAPGEEGFMVWTGLINDVMPLIRYRIGDRGCWRVGEACACGRKFPLVVPTITRESDLLRCPDGRVFSPRALNQLLKDASSFRFAQFLQDHPRHVAVRAVSNSVRASGELAAVRRQLQKLLGDGMEVTAELATEPLVRPGGKIPLIVRNVPALPAGGQEA